DLALDDRAVREREREPARLLVPLRKDSHQLGMALAVDEPAVRVDEPEAAVAGHAGPAELDLVGVQQVERLHRRDRDARDLAFHLANLATGAARALPRLRRRDGRRP